MKSILQVGAVGGVLAWFMFRNEPRLRSMEAAIDAASRSVLLLIISVPQVVESVKKEAAKMLEQIETRERQRGEEP